ncbi:methyltransferase domain-containing protein [Rhodocaloribacter sp.]
MPSFVERLHAEELMDDLSITDDRLLRALDELRWVNRLLGGYATTMRVLAPYLEARRGRAVRLLDLGAGVGDYAEHIVRWADRRGLDVSVTAVDANPVTVAHARRTLDRRLPPKLRARIHVAVEDALALPYADDAFDVVMAAMFMHHFRAEDAVSLVREMNRVARDGILVNDLHRHPLAYYGILVPARLLPVSPMFRHDAPVSVLRGFRRADLEAVARDAGLDAYRIRRHWAFRWSLSTLTA